MDILSLARPSTKPSMAILFCQYAISLSFACLLFFPFLSAQWGIADDHEIQYFLGKDAKMAFAEIPSMLLKETEAGIPGGSVRFRPVYYALRLTETAFWGGNLAGWYASRILTFSLFAFIAWHLLSRSLGIILGGVACLPLLFHSAWSDIFGRLGPSEAYAVLALSFYALAAVNLISAKQKEKSARWWWLLAASSIVAIGSKENMLFLLITTAALTFNLWRKKRVGCSAIIANVLIFGFGIFVFGALAVALKNQGIDIYGRTVMPVSRVQVLITELLSPGQWKILLPLCLSSVSFVMINIIRTKLEVNSTTDRIYNELRKLVSIEVVLVLLWYSQILFYNGKWPGGTRYDFPGAIARDLAYIFMFISCYRLSASVIEEWSLSKKTRVMAMLLGGFAALFIISFGIKSVKIVIDDHQAKSANTVKFTQRVAAIATRLRENPGIPVIFISHSVNDFEALDSVRTLISYYGVNNPLALKIEGWSESSCPEDKLYLLRELMDISVNGQPQRARGLLSYTPLHRIEQAPECFAVTFSGGASSRCRVIGEINNAELF